MNDTLEKAQLTETSVELENFEKAFRESKLDDTISSLCNTYGYKNYGAFVNETKKTFNVNLTIRKLSEDNSVSSYMNFFDSLYEVSKFLMKKHSLMDIKVEFKVVDKILAMYFILIYKK